VRFITVRLARRRAIRATRHHILPLLLTVARHAIQYLVIRMFVRFVRRGTVSCHRY
jgi:hypothetical protein